MHEIKQVDWAETIGLISYGVRFAIRTNARDTLDLLQGHLPPRCRRTSAAVDGRLYSVAIGNPSERSSLKDSNLLWRNSTLLIKTRHRHEVLSALESDLKLFVAESSPSGIFIHSGVVGWKGKAILIPGYSFSGKSTLVSELVQCGAEYYSDEYAVIDKQGRVRPYPKPIRLRHKNALGTTDYSLDAAWVVPPVAPIPVGLVFVSWYKPGTARQAREISPR